MVRRLRFCVTYSAHVISSSSVLDMDPQASGVAQVGRLRLRVQGLHYNFVSGTRIQCDFFLLRYPNKIDSVYPFIPRVPDSNQPDVCCSLQAVHNSSTVQSGILGTSSERWDSDGLESVASASSNFNPWKCRSDVFVIQFFQVIQLPVSSNLSRFCH